MYDEVLYSSTVIYHNNGHKSYLFPTLRMVLVTEGEATWLIGGKQYDCEKGDIVLLNNCMERMITDVRKVPFRLDIFEFSPALFSDRIRLIEGFYDNHFCVIKNNLECAVRIKNLLLEIRHEILKESTCREEFSKALLTACLVLAGQIQGEKKCSSEFGINTALQAAAHIWSDYKEEINAAGVAQRVGIAKGQLEKSFKAMFGQSIASYIRNYRMYRTMNDIKKNQGRKNILDIAFDNGFTSSAGFYKAFKAMNQSTPSAFVNNNLEEKTYEGINMERISKN